jgi:hypothetical protein
MTESQRARINECQRLRYPRNRSKILSKNKAWRESNTDKLKLYRRAKYLRERESILKRNRENYATNPKRRAYIYHVRLRSKYGLSPEKFEEILKQQGYCCAICREPFTCTRYRHVDHCHDTKIVRGILCNRCNAGIGYFRNSPQIALEAAHYLNRSQAVYTTPQ